jgi:Ser/Thr protein kinase RdoA (MazF antagonist)
VSMLGTGSPPRAILASIERRNLSAQPLDSRGQPWLLEAADWRAVLRHLPPWRYPPAESLPHMEWLHRFLDRLTSVEVATPRPIRELGGASIAVADGALWELLTYVPGQALLWDPRVPLESAGGMLANFHLASREVSTPDQRPGALPLEDCYPAAAGALASEFHRDLADLDQASVDWCVLHADCTLSNMLMSGEPPTTTGMIDFMLAQVGPPEADISFALWVTGRTEQPQRRLDYARVRGFVSGYHRVRPLTAWAAKAIPVYLVGRGMQLLTRIERAGGTDEVQLERVRWLHAHRAELEDLVSGVVESPAATAA